MPHDAPIPAELARRRTHRRGPPAKMDDAEVRAFVAARIRAQTFDQLADAARAEFGPDRAPARSTLNRWWHANRRHLAPVAPTTTESRHLAGRPRCFRNRPPPPGDARMAKQKLQSVETLNGAEPAAPTRAAVWRESPSKLRNRALAVLTYLGQVVRQEGDHRYSPRCVRAIGWHIIRMVDVLTIAEGAASETEPVTFELEDGLSEPGDFLHAARQCLIIVAEHHEFGDFECTSNEDDEEQGLAVLVQMALAFLDDAETEFDKRTGRAPAAPPEAVIDGTE